MFCTEPIINVYKTIQTYEEDSNAFFDCYHDIIAFHITEKERIILETRKHYISLEFQGVFITEKKMPIEDFAKEGEEISSYKRVIYLEEDEPPWIDYEFTLFVGERLVDVMQLDIGFLLKFDHFQMKIIPHNSCNSIPNLERKNHWSYFHVLGAKRYLTEKCACGGEGELLLDFVSDYVVRCEKCKMSTWAQMNAKDAIEEWNAGSIHCDLSDIIIE